MKAELKFEYDTEDFDACNNIKVIQHAWNYRLALEDMRDWFRTQRKYDMPDYKFSDLKAKVVSKPEEAMNFIEEVLGIASERMFEFIDDREIKID